MNEQLKEDVRIQDIVAKTARVNLRDTVRVLRALSMVLGALEDNSAKSRLNSWLHQSARFGDYASPLHSKPDATAIEACDGVADAIRAMYGDEAVDGLYALQTDPFFDNEQSDEEFWEGTE